MIVASPTLAPVTNGNSRKGDVSNVVSCMQHVYNEGPVKGSRNMKLMRMASSYKRSGVPYLVALNGLLTWANGTLPDNEVIRSVLLMKATMFIVAKIILWQNIATQNVYILKTKIMF